MRQTSLAEQDELRSGARLGTMLESLGPQTASNFMNRDFAHVRSGLEKVIGSGLRQISPAERPVLAWPLACGSKVGARTRALDFAGGVLRVEVPDVGWRVELQALAPQYVAVINRYAPEKVKRIDFVLAGALSSEERRRF